MTAVLFDLDGTLLNTLDDLADAVNATLAHFGCPSRTKEEVRQFVGNGARQLIRLSLPGSADDPELSQALAWFQDYYGAHSQIKTCPYEGILEAISAIQEEFPVAIVSNKPDKAVKGLCAQYFGDVYAKGESSACPRKPAPDMVFQAMDAIGAERCVYVGDSEVDVLTARNAGMPCLSVLWGFRDRKTLLEAGADCFCERPDDLLNCLKEMIESYGK